MGQRVVRVESRQWAMRVAERLEGATFPMDEDEATRVLEGVMIDHTPATQLVSGMQFPVNSAADLLHEISKQTCMTACPPEEDWIPKVTRAMTEMTFPLSREEAEERLKGISISGKDASEVLRGMDFPIRTPSDLLHALADQAEASESHPAGPTHEIRK